MRRDATLPGHAVLSAVTTARQAYDYLLGNLAGWGPRGRRHRALDVLAGRPGAGEPARPATAA